MPIHILHSCVDQFSPGPHRGRKHRHSAKFLPALGVPCSGLFHEAAPSRSTAAREPHGAHRTRADLALEDEVASQHDAGAEAHAASVAEKAREVSRRARSTNSATGEDEA